jgi:hypothetical protein
MKSFKPYPKALFIIALICCSPTVFSQSPPPPDYTFTSPSLVSGTLNAVGSVYRFASVKPGTDALVTITGAVNATVATLDQTGQGWNVAFQPNITVTKLTTGYVDFRIDFVVAGSSTPQAQTQVAVTAMDIDGYNFNANQRLWEFEQFDMGPGSYVDFEFAGSDINVAFVGNAVRAQNVAGVEYGSINQSPNVRFTVINASVSSMTVRSGAINQDQFNNVTRQRSFYFARFSYPNSALLPAASLTGFDARVRGGSVELNWALAKDHSIDKIDVEKSSGNGAFIKINTVPGNHSGAIDYDAKGENYYRLKLYENDGKFFYSKTIFVKNSQEHINGISVVSLAENRKCRIYYAAKEQSSLQLLLADAAGRVYLTRRINADAGKNVIDVDIESNMLPGNYFVTVITREGRHTGKIVVRH